MFNTLLAVALWFLVISFTCYAPLELTRLILIANAARPSWDYVVGLVLMWVFYGAGMLVVLNKCMEARDE